MINYYLIITVILKGLFIKIYFKKSKNVYRYISCTQKCMLYKFNYQTLLTNEKLEGINFHK